jgi:rod shape-determining protein MreC
MLASPFWFIPRTLRLFKENRELNRALFKLNRENASLKEMAAENQRLRQMLNFVVTTELDYIPAIVVGKSSSGTLNSITLDKGWIQGVKKGMPVVSAEGLVGRVISVGREQALCQLMLDHRFAVAVKVQRNRIDGILHWDSGDVCRLDGILNNMEVRTGDTLITSELGGSYPKGLNVGVVEKARKEQGKLFQRVLVKPFCNFHRLEEVFVIKILKKESGN